MNARDRGEKLTKEGAGRVCVYRLSNVIHSYTLECGLHYYHKKETLLSLPKTQHFPQYKFFYKIYLTFPRGAPFLEPPAALQNNLPIYFTIEIYENVGKSMLISILDLSEKNSSAEVGNKKHRNLQDLRTELINLYTKPKDVDTTTNQNYRSRRPSVGPGNKALATEYVKDHKESFSIPKKLPESVSYPEKRASSMSQMKQKRARGFNPNLYAKIGELLTSMTLERKISEIIPEPELKALKLVRVYFTSKLLCLIKS